MIVGIIIYILINFNHSMDYTKDTDLKMDFRIWFYGYSCIYFLYFLRRLYLLCIWFREDDPRYIQGIVNFYTFISLNTIEMGWFIWGNTLFY